MCAAGVLRCMQYVVTFYASRPGRDEVMVVEHHVSEGIVAGYTDAPAATLAAIRIADPRKRIDGFRVTDDSGTIVCDHADDGGTP